MKYCSFASEIQTYLEESHEIFMHLYRSVYKQNSPSLGEARSFIVFFPPSSPSTHLGERCNANVFFLPLPHDVRRKKKVVFDIATFQLTLCLLSGTVWILQCFIFYLQFIFYIVHIFRALNLNLGNLFLLFRSLFLVLLLLLTGRGLTL